MKHINDFKISIWLCFRQLKTMKAESPLTSIDIMDDGATFAVGSTRGKIYVYDLRKGTHCKVALLWCAVLDQRESKGQEMIASNRNKQLCF